LFHNLKHVLHDLRETVSEDLAMYQRISSSSSTARGDQVISAIGRSAPSLARAESLPVIKLAQTFVYGEAQLKLLNDVGHRYVIRQFLKDLKCNSLGSHDIFLGLKISSGLINELSIMVGVNVFARVAQLALQTLRHERNAIRRC